MKTWIAVAALTFHLLISADAKAELTGPGQDPLEASCSASGTCPDGSTGSCSAEGRYTHCKGQYNNEGPTCWVSNSGGECGSTDTGCTKISGCRK